MYAPTLTLASVTCVDALRREAAFMTACASKARVAFDGSDAKAHAPAARYQVRLACWRIPRCHHISHTHIHAHTLTHTHTHTHIQHLVTHASINDCALRVCVCVCVCVCVRACEYLDSGPIVFTFFHLAPVPCKQRWSRSSAKGCHWPRHCPKL